jgi:hypothetical protein
MKQGRMANRPLTRVLDVTARPLARTSSSTRSLSASSAASSITPAGR